MGLSFFTSVILLPLSIYALPHQPSDTVSSALGVSKRCGPVSQFYRPKQPDWDTYKTDDFLNDWWNQHQNEFSSSGGFAGAYGMWALGNPSWTCQDNGASDDCALDVCDSRVLNDKGGQTRNAYYVLLGVHHLNTYFNGLHDSFVVSAIGAALSKDQWATKFYKDKDDKQVTALKETLNAVQTIVGVGAAFASLGGPAGAIGGGAVSAIFSGAVGAVDPLIGQHQDDTFQKAADLGGILGHVVVESLKDFIAANNDLMQGKNYQNTGDIRSYLSGGALLDYQGVDKKSVIEVMNNFLIGNAVNQLYRAQKIFIMGGGQCGDGQGIGSGPQKATLCRDGKAWYLYYWQENDAAVSMTSHQWGWVAFPPGADQLGQGDYAGVKIEDIISSSLDSYNVAGYDYNADTARERAHSALRDGWRNPGAQGPSWEGTFTIPVCDVGWAADSVLKRKEWILQPYGHESRPNWCGAICSNDPQKTKAFIHAANMDGFRSPKHLCGSDAPY